MMIEPNVITEEILDFARGYAYNVPQELIQALKIRFWTDSDTAWYIWELTGGQAND